MHYIETQVLYVSISHMSSDVIYYLHIYYNQNQQVDEMKLKRKTSLILSLSTIVLNSRDWYEIIWLPEISRFKNQPCNRFYPKNQLECIGKAVMMLYLG